MKISVTASLLRFVARVKIDYNDVIIQHGVTYSARTILKANKFLWDSSNKVWYTTNFYTYYSFMKHELDRFNCYYEQKLIEHDAPFGDVFSINSYDESGAKLREYQTDHIKQLSKVDFAICGNDMRTGKSAILTKLVGMALNRSIIIVPNRILYETYNNVQKWLNGDKSVRLLDSNYMKARDVVEITADINIIPFSMVAKVGDRLDVGKEKFNMFIDESHKCANNKSNRSEGFKQLFTVDNVASIHLFTGTLFNNEPSEIIGLMENMNTKHIVSGITNFRHDILGQELVEQQIGYGKNARKFKTWTPCAEDAYYTDQFREFLTAINYVRVEKHEILDELPPVIHQNVEITRFNYTGSEVKELSSENIGADSNLFAMARKYAIKKVGSPEFKDFFLDKVNKTIICYYHEEVLAKMTELADKNKIEYSVVNGSTSDIKQHEGIVAFQEGDVPVIFVQLSMVEGLTLSSATEIFMVELPFTKSTLDQAVDRFWDYNSKEIKTVYYVLDYQGADCRKLEILNRKAELSKGFSNGGKDEI